MLWHKKIAQCILNIKQICDHNDARNENLTFKAYSVKNTESSTSELKDVQENKTGDHRNGVT